MFCCPICNESTAYETPWQNLVWERIWSTMIYHQPNLSFSGWYAVLFMLICIVLVSLNVFHFFTARIVQQFFSNALFFPSFATSEVAFNCKQFCSTVTQKQPLQKGIGFNKRRICDKSTLTEMHIPGLLCTIGKKYRWQLFDKKPPQGGHTSNIRNPSGRRTFRIWEILVQRYTEYKICCCFFLSWNNCNVSLFCQIQFCPKRLRSVFQRVHLLFLQISEWQLYFCKKTKTQML